MVARIILSLYLLDECILKLSGYEMRWHNYVYIALVCLTHLDLGDDGKRKGDDRDPTMGVNYHLQVVNVCFSMKLGFMDHMVI